MVTMRAEGKCRGLLHKIGGEAGLSQYVHVSMGSARRSPWAKPLCTFNGGDRCHRRHVPFSVVPNANEDNPSALSQVQRRAVSELLRVSPVADDLARRFQEAGFSLALVGGSVRDALLGRLGNDLDFTTDARPEDVLKIVRPWADAVWEVGIAFGTVGGAQRRDGYQIEVTTYRSEAYDRTSRKPEVSYGDSIEEDLVRRDFTVNAMAVALPEKEFIDPHGGLEDLAARVLRTPGTPEESFSDDPLRMMRAARFAAQLDFEVAPEVVAAMTDMADRIEIVSAERVRDELNKLILSAHPRKGLTPAGRHRARRARPARAAGAAAGARRAPPAQGRLRAHADRPGAGDRAGGRTGRTSPCGWPRCCTTSASPALVGSRRTAGSPSTTTRWWAPR